VHVADLFDSVFQRSRAHLFFVFVVHTMSAMWPGLCSSPGGRHPLSCLLAFSPSIKRPNFTKKQRAQCPRSSSRLCVRRLTALEAENYKQDHRFLPYLRTNPLSVRERAMCLSTDGEWLGVPWVLVDRASVNSLLPQLQGTSQQGRPPSGRAAA
jgi:hypothetical protein